MDIDHLEQRIAALEVNNVEQRVAELEANLQAVTDSRARIDNLITGSTHMYFRCLHSHKLYPADYVRQWGKKYGIGLGGDVRSECLDTMYEQKPYIGDAIRNSTGVMHPCRVSGAPLDLLFLPEEAEMEDLLIPAHADKYGELRGRIILANQLKHPDSQVAHFRALYIQMGGTQ